MFIVWWGFGTSDVVVESLVFVRVFACLSSTAELLAEFSQENLRHLNIIKSFSDTGHDTRIQMLLCSLEQQIKSGFFYTSEKRSPGCDTAHE